MLIESQAGNDGTLILVHATISVHFVDVSRMRDEDVEEHGFIAGYELILKAICNRKLDGKMEFLVHHLELYNSVARQVLIRYMSRYSDLDTETFYDKIIE